MYGVVLRIFWKMAGALVILLAVVVLMSNFFFKCLTHGFDQTHVGQVGLDPCDELA